MRKKTREGKEGDRFKILLKKEEKTRTTKRRANSLGNSKPALSGEFQTGGDILGGNFFPAQIATYSLFLIPNSFLFSSSFRILG